MAEKFYLRVVRAFPGGMFRQSGQDIRFESKKSCQTAAESLQTDFDEDCDPKRVYILDEDFVPVDAAGKPPRSMRK